MKKRAILLIALMSIITLFTSASGFNSSDALVTKTKNEITLHAIKKELIKPNLEISKKNIINTEDLQLNKIICVEKTVQEETTKDHLKTSWTGSKLTKRGGVNWGPSGKETWYSQKVLPGKGLKIPGRHVAEDGTIRDIYGYIVVASDLSYFPRYSIIETSLGMAKVYDTGCDYGTIDIYVDW